jgi:hypothetical protein
MEASSQPSSQPKPKSTFLFVESLRRKIGQSDKENLCPDSADFYSVGGISFSSSSDSQFTAIQLSSRRGSRKSSRLGVTKDKLEDFDSILASEASFDVLSDFSFVEEDRHSKISTLILAPASTSKANQSTSTARSPLKLDEVPNDVRMSTVYTNLSSDTSQVIVNRESPTRVTPDFEDSKLKSALRGMTSATTWEGEEDRLSPLKANLGALQTFTYCTRCQREVCTDVTVRMKPMGV